MSNYRDELEAIRQRTESLELQLEEKDREIERLRGTEDAQARMARLESDLAEAQGALKSLRRDLGPKRSGVRPFVVLGAGVGVFVVAIGGIVFLSRSPSRPRPVPVYVSSVRPTSVLPPEPPPPVVPLAPPKTVDVTIRGKVSKVSGRKFPVGTACTVDASLSASGAPIHVDRVRVSCDDSNLYDSNDPLNGMSFHSAAVKQLFGTARGKVRFAIAWEDKGERTGARTQASLDTFKHVATVWSTSAPPFNVELAIDEKSTTDEDPLVVVPDGATCRELSVPVKVASVRGSIDVKAGQSCTLGTRPGSSVNSCRFRIMCGATEVYGPGPTGTKGYVALRDRKHFVDDAPSSDDGDPLLSWDVGESGMVVKDEGARPFVVELEVPKGTDPLTAPN